MDKRASAAQSRRKRPGTPNLNRPINPIRTNQSAYLVTNKKSSYSPLPPTTVDFITASEDELEDLDPVVENRPQQPHQQQQHNVPIDVYITETSDSDGDTDKDKELDSGSRTLLQSSGNHAITIQKTNSPTSITSQPRQNPQDAVQTTFIHVNNMRNHASGSNVTSESAKGQSCGWEDEKGRHKMTNSKMSQGTNTSTTVDGLPPLEGIHGAFGFGIGCDLFRKSNKNASIYECESDSDGKSDKDIGDGDHETETDEDEVEERKSRLDRIKVSRSIFFDRSSGRRQAYGAVIQVQNVSDYHMTYCVRSSSPEIFRIQPQIGMIEPRGSVDVVVQTNPKFDFYFSDISQEVFKVLATPVYTRTQMEQSKLEILWRAYGTKYFPRVVAETHLINAVYPIDSAAGETSGTILSDILRSIRAYRGNDKKVPEVDNPVSEDVFLNSWPLEDDHFAFLSCREQLCGWVSMYKKAKKETRRMRLEMRSCLASIIVAASVFLVIMSMLESPEERKMNSERLVKGFVNFFSRFIVNPLAPTAVLVQTESEPEGWWEMAQAWAFKLIPVI